MVGDGICQPECLNEACSSDGGDCDDSLCSARCYPYMVSNGHCEDDCHVEECLWDGRDCDCSAGCTRALLSNSQCDPFCANAACGFDGGRCECSPGCSESMRGDGECNLECLTAACESDHGDCECAPGCLYTELGHCKPECQVPECNYDMADPADLFCQNSPLNLDCSTVECTTMWGEEIENCDFTCAQCNTTITYKMNCCGGCCSEHYFPHPASPTVCVRAPDRTSEQRPRVIIVSSDSAMDSLSAAFNSIFEKYVEVRLSSGIHSLSASKYFIDYTDFFPSSSEHTQQVEALRSMKITSQSCVDSPNSCERAVVVLEEEATTPFFSFSGSRYLEVTNVDFTSARPKVLCNQHLMGCTALIDLFSIRNGMTAKFVNVTFRNFNSSMTSILSVTNSKLVLENVDFTGVMMHANTNERGLITLINAEATYTHGSITLTNNLWDYDTLESASGALGAVNGTLNINGVSFANNFMAMADRASKLASLIHLRDCWRVTITNCDFAFNVGRAGAVLSIFTFAWESTSRNYETALKILDALIEVSNCTFRNNTGSVGTSIYVHYLSGQQNILITNCTFLNEFAEVNSVIAGYSRSSVSKIRSKSIGVATVNGDIRTVEFPVPRFTVSHSLFRNCNLGLFGLIALKNIWSARIEGITVEEAPTGDLRNVSTNSLNVLKTIPGAHLPNSIPSSFPEECQSLFNFTSTVWLEIESLPVAQSRCRNIVIATGWNVSICRSYFGWNQGTLASGFVLHIESSFAAVSEVKVEGNRNESPNCKGSVYFTGGIVNISSSHFVLNSASYGAALYLGNVQSAELRACIFEHNNADIGGAIAIEGNGTTAFSAYSSVFRNNSAAGYGGAISVTAGSEQFNAKVFHVDSVFERCRSTTGSAVFISEGVVLLPGSQCKRCRFTDNVSFQQGTCLFEQVSGEMAFISSRFERNIGLYTSVLHATYSRSQSTHLLIFTDVLFEGNEAQATVSITSASSPLEVAGSTVKCRSNAGTCLSVESANFTCSQCDFVSNSAESGAALQFHTSLATCEDCEFRSNAAEVTGGAVLVKSYSAFACRRCAFHNNTSQWQGGALFVEQQSSFYLDTATFTRNSARRGGLAFFLILSDVQSVVRFSRFTLNEGANYGCINLINAVLKLEECDFTENLSIDLMSGLMLTQSVARIESCRFANQTGVLGVFLYAISSIVEVSRSLFSNGTATNVGAAVALVSSQANITFCRFEVLTSNFGGALNAQDDSSLAIDSCFFIHIYSKSINRGVLVITNSFLSLSNSSLSTYDQGAVYGLQANIAVKNSSFLNGTGTLGGAIACSKCALATVENSSFEGLTAEQGVGVYLEGSTGSFLVSGCRFLLCKGSLTGAVRVEESPGSILNCLFLGNSADRGGALHITASSLSSAISITGNRFDSNSAASRGAAICWESTQPILQGNEFSNNTAVYGPDIASYPVKMSMKNVGTSPLANVTSGKTLARPLVLELLDVYGQVVADDNDSIAQIMALDNRTAVSGEVRVQAKSGQFIFTDCSIIAQPGANISIKIATSAIALENSIVAPVSVRYCVKGEYLASDSCVPCASGTYSFTNHSNCESCPSNAVCFGNFTIAPKSGYWRSSLDTDTFLQCSNADACLGSLNGTNLTGACAAGYRGVKCQACASGYYQWGTFYCSECSKFSTRIGLHVFVSGLLIAALGTTIGLVLWHRSSLVFHIKIFVNYTQVVMLFRSSGLTWPQEILQLFNAYEVVGAFPEFIVSANCIMEDYYEKLLAMSLVQPAIVLAAFALWGAVAILKGSMHYLRSSFVSTVVAICFLTFPSVVWTMLESFYCEEIDKGEYWLLEHSLQCWTAQHTKYAFGLALPCLIVYGFVLPVAGFAFLRREKHSVHFRYATFGYSQRRCHWEFVVLFWKGLVITCFTLLFRVSALFPVLTVFCATVGAGGVLASRRRSRQGEFDSLEVQSLMVCAATLYVGLMLSAEVVRSSASAAPLGVVLALNVYFSGTFVLRICVVLYNQIKKKFHQTQVVEESNEPT